MGLRTDLKNLTEKVDTQFMQFMRNIDEVKANVTVAATADGAAEPAVGGTSSNAMAEVEKLEEAMEDRFIMMQVQLDSLTASCPVCPCTTGNCPCACNQGAPVKEPPDGARRLEEDAWTKKGADPWTAPRRGDDGDDGDDDNGDGNDDDYFIGTPGGRGGGRGPKRAHESEYGKLFEAKDATFLP